MRYDWTRLRCAASLAKINITYFCQIWSKISEIIYRTLLNVIMCHVSHSSQLMVNPWIGLFLSKIQKLCNLCLFYLITNTVWIPRDSMLISMPYLAIVKEKNWWYYLHSIYELEFGWFWKIYNNFYTDLYFEMHDIRHIFMFMKTARRTTQV